MAKLDNLGAQENASTSDQNTASHKPSVSNRAVDGAFFTTASVITQGLGQILVLAILARHITQTEFGLVTATMVMVGLGKQLAEGLICPVLVHRENFSARDIGTASTLSWLFGGVAVIAMWLLAPLIGHWLSEPSIVPIISVLSLVFLIQAPSMVAEGLLQRELNFQQLALAEVLSFVFGYTLVGVTLALAGAGVWALVWACLAQLGLKCFILIWQKPRSLLLAFDPGAARHMLWLSGGFSSGKLLGFAATQLDNLVVAAAMNASAVGIYGRAYQLVTMPVMLFGQVLERVMFPIYSRLQSEPQKASEHYGHAVALSSMLMAPTSVLLVVLAPEIVRLILGPEWSETVLPLQILASTLLFRMGYKLNDPITKGFGLVYQRLWRLAVYAGSVLVFASFGVQWGLPGVAVGVSFAILVHFLFMAHLTLCRLNISWRWFALKHARGLIYALCLLPVVQTTAMALRNVGIGYMGVLLGVLSLLGIGFLIALITRPSLVVGPELRWFARLLGRRLKPRSTDGILPESRSGLVVEFCGLTQDEKANLPAVIVQQLNKQGIPASEIKLNFGQHSAGTRQHIKCLGLALKSLRRAPRASIYQLLVMLGTEGQQQNNVIARMLSWLALGELVSKAQNTPGIHLLIDGPMQQLSVIGADKGHEEALAQAEPLLERLCPDLFLDLRMHKPVPVSLIDLVTKMHDKTGFLCTLVVDIADRQYDISLLAHDVIESLVSNWQVHKT